MHALSYAWSLPVMWQGWQSHHSICHCRKPHATHKPHGSVIKKRSQSKLILHCGNMGFYLFCSCDRDLNPMTFIYELDLYSALCFSVFNHYLYCNKRMSYGLIDWPILTSSLIFLFTDSLTHRMSSRFVLPGILFVCFQVHMQTAGIFMKLLPAIRA